MDTAARVCWVSDFLPRHDVSSSGLRVHELVKLIHGLKIEQTYIYFAQSPQDKNYLAGLDKKIRCIFSPFSEAGLTQQIAKAKPDYLFLTNIWTTEYASMLAHSIIPFIRKFHKKTKIIVDTMDFHAKKHYRAYCSGKDRSELVKSELFMNLESSIYRNADQIVTVSETERTDIMAAISDCMPIRVISNIVYPSDEDIKISDRRHCVFLGNYDVSHNRDAVDWFLREIFPLIRTANPTMEMHLVGANAEKYYTTNSPQGLFVQGYTDNLESTLSKYKVFACPLTYGAGVKGKIGSALACGLPVVSTSIGSEGFGLTPDEDILIRDTPESFAQACVQLEQDDTLWNKLSKNGRVALSSFNDTNAPILVLKEILNAVEMRTGTAR